MTDQQPIAATPKAKLEQEIMDSRVPKNEREWWARGEIERLRELLRHADAIIVWDAQMPPVRPGFQEEVEAALGIGTRMAQPPQTE